MMIMMMMMMALLSRQGSSLLSNVAKQQLADFDCCERNFLMSLIEELV